MSTEDTSRKVLLIVDDEPDFRLMLRLGLERAGYEVRQVGTGEEAITMLGDDDIDAVVLDVRLPGIDGWEVLRRIRASPGHDGLPVIMSSADDTARARGEAAGMGDAIYMAKPFDLGALTELIGSMLTA